MKVPQSYQTFFVKGFDSTKTPMRKPKSLLLAVGIVATVFSCYLEPPTRHLVDGYAPTYGSAADLGFKFIAPRSINNPGKIYIHGNYLLVNEKREGIHILDNTDPASPQFLGFIFLPGNTDMAIKDNVLFADYQGQIIALSVNDLNNLTELGRLPLKDWLLGMPPPKGSYFECVDPSKGVVVDWKFVELTNPSCYAL
jgi:hypothetical protein